MGRCQSSPPNVHHVLFTPFPTQLTTTTLVACLYSFKMMYTALCHCCCCCVVCEKHNTPRYLYTSTSSSPSKNVVLNILLWYIEHYKMYVHSLHPGMSISHSMILPHVIVTRYYYYNISATSMRRPLSYIQVLDTICYPPTCVLSRLVTSCVVSDFVPWCCVMSGLYPSFSSVFSSCKQSS